MSSDLNQRIADLEQQLAEARDTKYRLEDELNMYTSDSEIIAGLHRDLAKHEAVYEETQARIQELTEAKEAGIRHLDNVKAAADSIDALTEEVAAANDAAETARGALDEVMMTVHMLESKLHDLENAQGLLQQEYELAKTNEEYVGGLEKKINGVSEDISALDADLQEAADRKAICERDLFKALKSYQQSNMHLMEAQEAAERIIPIENQLLEIDAVLGEEEAKLSAHAEYIGQLQENINQQGTVNESQNAELKAVNSRIFDLAESLAGVRAQLDVLMAEESRVSEEMSNILTAVDCVCSYDELYQLEEAFNAVGMTIQKTTNDRSILCRVQDGKAMTDNVLEDFIFIGPTKRLHEGVIEKIKNFVMSNEGAACNPAHEIMTIMNEDKKFAIDFVTESSSSH